MKPVRNYDRCPCMEVGADGTKNHSAPAAGKRLKELGYGLTVVRACKNHDGNYADARWSFIPDPKPRFSLRRVLAWSFIAFFVAAMLLVAVSFAHAEDKAQYRKDEHGVVLNDLHFTPGAVLTTDAAKTCVPGYARSVRNVPLEVKKQVYALYGVQRKQGVCCEVDHLISLTLGGSNDITNLWPQPYSPEPGALQKDEVEFWLHEQVCAGKMTLVEAQDAIRKDWFSVYLQMKAHQVYGDAYGVNGKTTE